MSGGCGKQSIDPGAAVSRWALEVAPMAALAIRDSAKKNRVHGGRVGGILKSSHNPI